MGGSERINREAYAEAEVINEYEHRAFDRLFPQEVKVIDRYFSAEGKVLDIGCGTGRTTSCLTERGMDVVGIDMSPEMVESASTLFPEIEFYTGDAGHLPFEDETFRSILFSYNGLDYLSPTERRQDALSEMYRVLKPGGVVAFSSHNLWYHLPALLTDQNRIKKFYLENGNHRRLFQPYKIDGWKADLPTYISNPVTQWRQLREAGFSLQAIVGKREHLLKYFETMPHYVARKEMTTTGPPN